MKIQIIGLPCSGKTTLINKFLETKTGIDYVDIRSFPRLKKEYLFKKLISEHSGVLIAESACGVAVEPSFVIKISKPIQEIYKLLSLRDKDLDEDYLSLLETQMCPAHYVVSNEHQFMLILNKILSGYEI